MKNEIKITELRTIDLNFKENERVLNVLVRNIYGEWSTGFLVNKFVFCCPALNDTISSP